MPTLRAQEWYGRPGLAREEVTKREELISALKDSAAGGEWAGWQCDFDLAGRLKTAEVEQYCSEEMIEWGQAPVGFELLTTEHVTEDSLQRRFLRLLPEDGCAAENLSADVSASILPLDRLRGSVYLSTLAFDDPPEAARLDRSLWYLRTVFGSASAQKRSASA